MITGGNKAIAFPTPARTALASYSWVSWSVDGMKEPVAPLSSSGIEKAAQPHMSRVGIVCTRPQPSMPWSCLLDADAVGTCILTGSAWVWQAAVGCLPMQASMSQILHQGSLVAPRRVCTSTPDLWQAKSSFTCRQHADSAHSLPAGAAHRLSRPGRGHHTRPRPFCHRFGSSGALAHRLGFGGGCCRLGFADLGHCGLWDTDYYS